MDNKVKHTRQPDARGRRGILRDRPSKIKTVCCFSLSPLRVCQISKSSRSGRHFTFPYLLRARTYTHTAHFSSVRFLFHLHLHFHFHSSLSNFKSTPCSLHLHSGRTLTLFKQKKTNCHATFLLIK